MDKTADLIGDSHPGNEPQAEADRERIRRDYTDAVETDPDEYNFVLNGSVIAVHKDADHPELFGILDYRDLTRPYAYGLLTVHSNWDSVWEVTHTNMAMHEVAKRLKKYSRDHGWQFSGAIDETGMPFEGESMKVGAVPGIGDINPGVKDWHNKEWADTQQYDQNNQVQYYGEQDGADEHNPLSPHACSDCGQLFPDYNTWRLHTIQEHINPGRKPTEVISPVVDLDQVFPADFNQNVMDKTVMRQAQILVKQAASSDADISGPIPFIFDIEKDRIYVGHPGERHSDIQGRFTPGGIVEGVFDPKGHVQIRTDTDMPYTIRHMIQLWYAMHPELEVKGVYLLVGDKKYKLASSNIGHKVRNLAATDPAAWAVYERLAPYGNVYVVGGAVRDVVLGKVPKDTDLLVQGIEANDLADLLESLPGKVSYTGKSFGVYRYRDPHGNEVEVALPRTEASTGAGHQDFTVTASAYIPVAEDLARRDFTGNAIAVNLATGEITDPYDGIIDLKSGRLHTVSDSSFPEDPVRILRGLSSVSKHGLTPSEHVYSQMSKHGHTLANEPGERLQQELDSILSGDHPEVALKLAMDTGVMEYLLPEVYATKGYDQRNRHHDKVLDEHLLAVLASTAEQTCDIDLRLAALLHDIGKPRSRWIDDDGNGHFYFNKEAGLGEDHEDAGAEMTDELMRRLRYPNGRIDRVTHLVKHHMFASFKSENGARRFINRVGDENADDLLTLRFADNGGKLKGNAEDTSVDLERQLVDRVRVARQPTDRSQLAVTGRDLIKEGFTPGPDMGRIIDHLTDIVLEDPALNDRETLLKHAHEWSPGTVKRANILDPIQDELDSDVFDHPDSTMPRVKAKIVSWVRSQVFKTMRDAGWPDPTQYLDLVLTGSLTTYQWSAESDFDVSLFVNTEKLPEWVRADLIKLMVEKLDGTTVPGTTHPLQVFVVPPDVTREKLYKPGLRSAYDLDEDEWIVLPEPERSVDVSQRWPELITYAKMVEDKMRLLLEYDTEGAKQYWHFLHTRRQHDQKAGKGDYSESNITYKWLNNRGMFPLISEVTGEYLA
jgi:tRNA nucleotidyltransferase (CCA-adding enzyme)